MKFGIAATAALLAFVAAPQVAGAAGDAAAGEKIFNKCRVCHSLAEGKRKVGPPLFALFSRDATSFPGFQYSEDMAAAGKKIGRWDEPHFKAYIHAPQDYVGEQIGKPKARIKMVFPGLKTEQEADDLFAYLEPYLKGEKEGQ